MNDTSFGSSSSEVSNTPVQRWHPISKERQSTKHEKKVGESPKLSKNYISISLIDDVDLIDSFKTKIRSWDLNSKIHSLFQANNQGPKQPWVPKFFQWLQVLCDEQYDEKWYIDSGCSRHMTGRKENLHDFRSLENVGVV